MTPKDFVKLYLPYAKEAEIETGFSAIATLTQGAIESAWGKCMPGNMIFGVKDTDGVNGNEQLITTTEYSRRSNLKFPEIISITPTIRNGQKYFKYVVKDYFRKYDTPKDCFIDHVQFFLANERYSEAVKVRQYPDIFFDEIAKAGYATDPNYAAVLKSVARTIERAMI